MAWRPLVLAILVYVALDLSVAWMPGAFVFDADETVESVRTDSIQEIADTIACLLRHSVTIGGFLKVPPVGRS